MLGNVYIGAKGVAEDMAYLSSTPEILQIMQNVGYRYYQQHHYEIYPLKTKVAEYCGGRNLSECIWNLGDNQIQASEETTHLGLKRAVSVECEINSDDRIIIARRTKYAYLNSEYQGTNGWNPATSYQIYKTYILLRLLYGLEVMPLKKSLISMEQFHKSSLRIPERTATVAIYLLLGALPVEAEIHKKQLSLLHAILNSDNRKIKAVLDRQISVNFDNKDSLIQVSHLYDLLDIMTEATIIFKE